MVSNMMAYDGRWDRYDDRKRPKSLLIQLVYETSKGFLRSRGTDAHIFCSVKCTEIRLTY
jgi:hypothetical protein